MSSLGAAALENLISPRISPAFCSLSAVQRMFENL
jgi:hypothetical protein